MTAWPATVAAAEMKQERRQSGQSLDQTLLEMGGVSAMTDQQLGAADGIAACAVSPPQQGGAKKLPAVLAGILLSNALPIATV